MDRGSVQAVVTRLNEVNSLINSSETNSCLMQVPFVSQALVERKRPAHPN